MTWFFLILAIILEVSGTISMKLSQGFSKFLPSLAMFIFYGFSLVSLTLALKKIDVSIAYAVWSGLGTALIATAGMMWFKEPVSVFKLISLGLVIIGIIGLNLSGGGT
ncbi:MAG: multidrug efflux SMR transporter [Deltaproteobacteria bacterium]|nr:multidrug efflux SMR transporter [Deltaproteobacteria bacterium]MBW1985615.1 multidrug efflux SMR transporter [Deltaproteobacteria bacterium]MBW2134446.1 multidrug efflux SMR transporter [Deltaproteobacteria bacterium]